MDKFYDSWEVVCKNDKGEEKKFAVNTRQSDPAVVVDNFIAQTKHPHRPFDLKPVAAYPVDRAGVRIEDAPAWAASPEDVAPAAIAEVAGSAE